jgi:hypothetical protein
MVDAALLRALPAVLTRGNAGFFLRYSDDLEGLAPRLGIAAETEPRVDSLPASLPADSWASFEKLGFRKFTNEFICCNF